MTFSPCPKLRPLDVQAAHHNGRQVIVLRDPLGISDRTAVLPQSLAPLLALCDGSRDVSALRASLAVRYGIALPLDTIEQILGALDEALFLDNERFAQARQEQVQAFRSAPYREPALAPHSYPADPDALRKLLDGYLEEAGDVPEAGTLRGLVSPHIDYARGGPVYARVWKSSAKALGEAELVIMLGTDHHGSPGRITLTPQHYATPFGVLPTAGEVVNAIVDALSPQEVYAEEIHHRSEHSIELAAVWLHHVRGGQPCALVPILCGSFAHRVAGQADPAGDRRLAALVDALRTSTAGQRTVVVAAADLSHVGPAFGGQPLDLVGRALVRAADGRLIERMCAGDAAGFLSEITQVGDRYNVCGLPPIYLALRILGEVSGEAVAYELAPADHAGTSVVSICGLLWH